MFSVLGGETGRGPCRSPALLIIFLVLGVHRNRQHRQLDRHKNCEFHQIANSSQALLRQEQPPYPTRD